MRFVALGYASEHSIVRGSTFARIDFAGATSLHELYRRCELPREWLPELKAHAESAGLVFLCTAFDEDTADALDALGLCAFKIASYEMSHLPLLRCVARKGKPILLSTGTAYLGEVDEAIQTIYAEDNRQVILLHCTASYPARAESANLAAMVSMARAFDVPVGYSDHTIGTTVPIAAATLGAACLEKHFTLDRALPGPDHSFALEADELAFMVRAVRDAEAALGSPVKAPVPDEMEHRTRGRRSIFARTDITRGTTITADMLQILRPGIGLAPRMFEVVIGRTASRDIHASDPITWTDL
jgi:N-acetylneuraminate synthase/N,N'-diacetyllegionaminate synthase